METEKNPFPQKPERQNESIPSSNPTSPGEALGYTPPKPRENPPQPQIDSNPKPEK